MKANVKFLLRQFDGIVEQLADEMKDVEELLDLRIELELRILDVLEDYVDGFCADTEFIEAYSFLHNRPSGTSNHVEGDEN